MQFAFECASAGYSLGCDPLNQEPPMRQYQHDDESARETDTWIRIVLAAHGLILLVIVALVANNPAIPEWISAAAQAEFVNPDIASVGPTQLAQPDQMRIVRNN
jgi:hypothetical protein